MTTSSNLPKCYRFGSFHLDTVNQQLLLEGTRLPLPPKVYEALLLLVENSGQVVSKETLLTRLWPDCFVEENSLTQMMFQVRKALGESAATQQFVKTVYKRGYQFVAAVTPVPPSAFSRLSEEINEEATTNGKEAEPRLKPAEELCEAVVTEAPPAPATKVATPVCAPTTVGFVGRRAWLWGAGLIVTLALVGLVWFFRPPAPPEISFNKMQFTRLTTSGKARLSALSRDGKYVAYIVDEAAQQSLWVRQTLAANAVQVVAPAAVAYHGLTFAPDANFIYYVTAPTGQPISKLFQAPTLGGASKEVLTDVDSAISFAPDGQHFAFVRNYPDRQEAALLVAQADGTHEQTALTQKWQERYYLGAPAWSPDGQTMICVTAQHSGQDAAYQLLAVRLADGALSRLGVRDWDWIGQVAWVKDGSGLIVNAWDSGSAVVADQLWFVAWPNGETRRVTNDLLNYAGVSVAVEAALLTTTRTERVTSLWVRAPGNRAQDLPPQISFGDTYSELLGMDWTADGRIVYASQASGNVDIWSRRPDGTDQRQLTSAPRAETAPVVAPDGQTILYVSYRSGNPLAMSDPPVTPPLGVPHIWRMKADGSQQQQLTNGKGERSPSLSPDGQWLVYAAPEGRKPQLWKKNLAGGEAVRLSELPGLQPELSPDGRWVVCFLLNPEAGRMQFALIPFTANEPIRYLAQLPLPVWNTVRWTADSQALTFIQEANGVANLWRQSLSGGAPQQLTAFQNERIFRFAWSHDGQQLACERGVLLNDLVLINYRP